MALIKSKLTKNIWYRGQKWRLVNTYSPNEFDDFLILEKESDSVHEGWVPAMDVICIDCHNEEFYPDTASVRKYMVRIQKKYEEFEKVKDIERSMSEHWLGCFKNL